MQMGQRTNIPHNTRSTIVSKATTLTRSDGVFPRMNIPKIEARNFIVITLEGRTMTVKPFWSLSQAQQYVKDKHTFSDENITTVQVGNYIYTTSLDALLYPVMISRIIQIKKT